MMPATKTVKIMVVGPIDNYMRTVTAGYVNLTLRSVAGDEAPVAIRLRKPNPPQAPSAWATKVDYRVFEGRLYEPVPERPYRNEHVLSRLMLDDLALPRAAVKLFEDRTASPGFIQRSQEWGPFDKRDLPSPAKWSASGTRHYDLTETNLGVSCLGREDMLLVVDNVVHVRSLGPMYCKTRNPSLTKEPVLGPVEWITSSEALANAELRAGMTRYDLISDLGNEVEVLPAADDLLMDNDVPVVLDAMACLAFETFGRMRLSDIPRSALLALQTCAVAIRNTHGKEASVLESGPMSANPTIFSAFRPIHVDGVREAIADILDAFQGANLTQTCRAAYAILENFSTRPDLRIERLHGRAIDDDDLEALEMTGGFAP